MVACYSGLPEALVAAVDSDFARTVCALRGAETGFETGPRFEEAVEAEGGMAPLGAESFLPTAAVPAGVAVVPEMGPLGGFSCVGEVASLSKALTESGPVLETTPPVPSA